MLIIYIRTQRRYSVAIFYNGFHVVIGSQGGNLTVMSMTCSEQIRLVRCFKSESQTVFLYHS